MRWNTACAPLPDPSRTVTAGRGKRERAAIRAESRRSEPWKARAAGKPGTCLAASQIPRQQQHGPSASQQAMPGSNERGPQKKPINQHGWDQAHRSVKSAYCQRNAWPHAVAGIEHDPVCTRKQEVRNRAMPASLHLPFEKNRPISPKLKKPDISKADTSCKVRSSHRRREGRPQSGSAPRKGRQDGAGIGPAGRSRPRGGQAQLAGARALLAQLPSSSSIWEGARQGGDRCGERGRREKPGTAIGFVTSSEAAWILEKKYVRYFLCSQRGLFPL